jgi:YHS domain-containing protein
MAKNVSSEAIGAALAAFFFAASPTGAADRIETSAELLPPVIGATEVIVSDELSGLGLRGFDPVTFFLGDGPKVGRPKLEALWKGVAWRFASEANREAFRRDPDVYAPQIGGHDPNAAADGHLVAGDPALFAIHESGLYLFRSEEARRRFLASPGAAARAEARWRNLAQGLVQP